MPYRKSRYNILVPHQNGKTILFNPLSGAIGTFDADALRRYHTNTCTDQEVQLLLKKGVFIPEGYDEREKIAQDRAQGIYDDSRKYIRIWTTSACNARCYYCYEKGIPFVSMEEATADALIRFLDPMIKPHDMLYLEWFGGEPLLNQPIISYIMDGLENICRERDCRISGKMITNGSLIDQSVVERLIAWKISSVQITLDGYAADYDRVKNYLNPRTHNFNKVIDAIKLLNDVGIQLAIRMNYDTTNYESLTQLIGFLHREFKGRKHIFYYIYPIWSALDDKADSPFISSTEADENYLKLLKLLVEHRMSTIKSLARLNYKRSRCKSCTVNGYSIFPNGDIGKCSETFIQTIGDVWRGVVNQKLADDWTSTDLEEACNACIYLPLCQGGCQSSRFTRMPRCYINKRILPDILRWYVDSLQPNRDAT